MCVYVFYPRVICGSLTSAETVTFLRLHYCVDQSDPHAGSNLCPGVAKLGAMCCMVLLWGCAANGGFSGTALEWQSGQCMQCSLSRVVLQALAAPLLWDVSWNEHCLQGNSVHTTYCLWAISETHDQHWGLDDRAL